MDRLTLNQQLAQGSTGVSWTPRITENQLRAIEDALGPGTAEVHRGRLRSYVESGDLNALDSAEQATLGEWTRRARAGALTQDDVKRIWPRKVAVVALAASSATSQGVARKRPPQPRPRLEVEEPAAGYPIHEPRESARPHS